ncbi:hypothetical protein OTU49_016684, partial [Cherax quadricarinatus]
MGAWLVWAWWVAGMVTWAAATPTWQSCKSECDTHFSKNDLLQSALSRMCERGCDLFTVALISTPQRTRVLHLGPVILPSRTPALPRTPPHDLVVRVEKKNPLEKLGEHHHHHHHHLHHATDGNPPAHTRSPHHKTRQTTTQPADHPVQDHPAQADHQATTTHPGQGQAVHAAHQATTTHTPNTRPPTTTAGAQAAREEGHETNAIIILGKDNLHQGDKSEEYTQLTPEEFQEARVVQDGERLQQAKDSCRHACVTAYHISEEQTACVVGCHYQAVTAATRPTRSRIAESGRNPLAMFQHIMFNLAGHVGRLVRVTWAWTTGGQRDSPHQERHDTLQAVPRLALSHGVSPAHNSQHKFPGGRVYYSELLGHYTIGVSDDVPLADPSFVHHH